MAVIVTRSSKGSALTHVEADANFTNLDTELGTKISASSTDTLTNKSGNISMFTNDSGYITSYTETNDLTQAVTWANIPDANVPQSAVTQHQAALSITESQISDLSHTTSLPFASITSTPTTIAGYGITDAATQYANTDVDAHLNTSTAASSEVLSWTGTDYDWVAQSGGIALTDISVTQNAAGTAALSYNNTTGVLSYTPPDLSSYLTAETNNLTSAVTWANVPDANITQSSVTQHQAALSITQSQISDLSHTTSLPFASITSTPTTLAGYGITDGYANSDVDTHLNTGTATTGQVLSWTGTDYDWITGGAGGGIGNVVEDTTPQLGGMLDVNGNSLGDGTLELLKFSETVSAVNEFTMGNAATGAGPTLSATGDDANIPININPKGTGRVAINGQLETNTIAGLGNTITFAENNYYFRNTTLNNFRLESDGSGTGVVLRAPTGMTSDFAITLPSADGTSGQVLQTNGSGVLSFVTVSGGGGGGDVVTDTTPQLGGDLDVNGNKIISASLSNGDIELAPDGTGNVKLTMASSNALATDANNTNRGTYYLIGSPTVGTGYYGANTTSTGMLNHYNRSLNGLAGRHYLDSIGKDIKFNNSGSTQSGSNARFRANQQQTLVDMNGLSYLDGNRAGRGIIGLRNNVNIMQSSTTHASDVQRSTALESQLYFSLGYDNDYNGVSGAQNLTVQHASVYSARLGTENNGGQSLNVTDSISIWNTHADSRDPSNSGVFNLSAGAKIYNMKNDRPHLIEKFGSVGYYSEMSYEATHSASGTLTVDYNNGNTQIVTLGANITSFTMSNFPGDNSSTGSPMIGSVTLFLKQDGTGGRTVSFTAGLGETFKIANGVTTVDTGAGNYTVVSVMHVDGTYLWTVSGNYV